MPINFNLYIRLLPSALGGIVPIVSIVSIVSIVPIVSIASIVPKAFFALLVFLALRLGFYQFCLPAPFSLCMYLSQSLWGNRLPNMSN